MNNLQLNGLYLFDDTGFRIVKKTKCYISIVNCRVIKKYKDGVETYTLIETPSLQKRYKIYEDEHQGETSVYFNDPQRQYFKHRKWRVYTLTDETKFTNIIKSKE
jgi:hypothetical protein